MPATTELETDSCPSLRALQVEAGSGQWPKIVAHMENCRYLERAGHRLVRAWARLQSV